MSSNEIIAWSWGLVSLVLRMIKKVNFFRNMAIFSALLWPIHFDIVMVGRGLVFLPIVRLDLINVSLPLRVISLFLHFSPGVL